MIEQFDPARHPHRRFNALNGSWNLVSPQRTERPWRGEETPPATSQRPGYEASCYLCPGNARAGGQRNPDYRGTHVFTNDFAALHPDEPPPAPVNHPLLQAVSVAGTCRVICYSPRHDLTLARMAVNEIGSVIDCWRAEEMALSADYQWIQIFENQGEMMGTSAPHPHGQVWAVNDLPQEALREQAQQSAYLQEHGTPLLLDYATMEMERAERVVITEEHWVALVPWWAIWPFEILLLPRGRLSTLARMTQGEKESLARTLKGLLTRYDNLFEAPFPYSMGWHTAPAQPAAADYWQLHAHFYPPLLRSAAVRKFMVGYELLSEGQRDLTPESAAARLRQVAAVHYSDRERE